MSYSLLKQSKLFGIKSPAENAPLVLHFILSATLRTGKMNRMVATAFLVLFLCLTQLPDTILSAPTDSVDSTDTAIICAKNEVPTNCASCSATCERPIPGRCNGPLCKPGCKCKFGYFKDSDGDCVSIIGCVIDNLRFEKEWSVFDFLDSVKKTKQN